LNGSVDWLLIAESLIYSLIILAIGQATYKKLNWRFAEVL
jgi:hypothetical protein